MSTPEKPVAPDEPTSVFEWIESPSDGAIQEFLAEVASIQAAAREATGSIIMLDDFLDASPGIQNVIVLSSDAIIRGQEADEPAPHESADFGAALSGHRAKADQPASTSTPKPKG